MTTARDVLGAVAHDLRQPLSNIETIAYYLTLVLPKDDPKIQQQLERIRELVQETDQIIATCILMRDAVPAANPV